MIFGFFMDIASGQKTQFFYALFCWFTFRLETITVLTMNEAHEEMIFGKKND